jgi:outer membrane protein OmpA-like peptidoglycan-associated protein
MVFVIGPFAGKWFNPSDFSASNDSSILWVVEENVTSLSKRLAHLKEHHSSMATFAFFPLLTDGVQNNGVMIEQITAWQYAFSSARLPGHLPCLLGLYTRLSQQRYPQDPDRAIWAGGVMAPPYGRLKLEPCLVSLIDELDNRNDGNDVYAIQRHALGGTLIAWLAENRLMNVLQTLFDSTQLDLAGVMLADHGQGFTRHGAWSHWLVEKYGILPGLAASLAVPPLPTIALAPMEETSLFAQPSVPVPARPHPIRRCRGKTAIMLIFSTFLIGGFGYYGSQQWEEVYKKVAQKKPFRLLFNESPPIADMPLFKLTGGMLLFENSSSKLMPDSEKTLAAIMLKIEQIHGKIFLITGHSDNTGSDDVNLALSIERARVIRDRLIENSSQPASQFIVEGAGSSLPIATNNTKEGRAQNRRVEIILLSERLVYEQETHNLSH